MAAAHPSRDRLPLLQQWHRADVHPHDRRL